MSDVAIKVENLSKQYRLGLVSTGTLSHDLNRWWHKVRGKDDPYLKISSRNDRTAHADSEYVWALQDINFEVKKGEVLGIIGRNGAGKSTLLKILSKVTGPTAGNIKIKGRIASLLEVGTGFHPELTGRENIFLNGAILGMTKTEIKNKFDEIVDFSGVERYIETPVKRYSSGMYVRLAFAVAAHLEPEILIVDEVLAVGDAEFQKKCLGKMKDVSELGRTVLFVSHNMAAVKSFCHRAVMLEQGLMVNEGDTENVVHKYLTAGGNITNHKTFAAERNIVEDFELLEIGIRVNDKGYETPMRIDEEFHLFIRFNNFNSARKLVTTLQFKNDSGDFLFVVTSSGQLQSIEGENNFTMIVPSNFFNVGDFYVNLLVVENGHRIVVRENDIISFTTQPIEKPTGGWIGKTVGSLKPVFKWQLTNAAG